jgi:3-hydroxyacyl-[acyl-carrier-protein] dehydratase
MRFELVDAILELTSGQRIVTVKAVSLAEEYLADHFPTFPVLPGVLMLEALAESAAWLVREARSFPGVVILLREARNVTYKSFVRPGQVLRLEVDCRSLEEDRSEFSGSGFCDGSEVLRARFGLMHGRFGRSDEAAPGAAERRGAEDRARFDLLRRSAGATVCASP